MLTSIILASAVAVSPSAKGSFQVSITIVESCRIERVADEQSIYCNGKAPHKVQKEPVRIKVKEMGVIEGQRLVVVF